MKTLLLLHGAMGSSAQLESLTDSLQDAYSIHVLNFPGHGGRELPTQLSIPSFADYVKEYIETNELNQVSVFGYSMGGYVGLYLAKQHPTLIDKVITLATKLEWNEAIAAKEIQMLQPAVIEQKVPAFATVLSDRHQPQDWKTIMLKTQEMLMELGKRNALLLTDYTALQTPILLLLGDRDKMVTLNETVAAYQQLPNAQLGILPATAHPIEQVDSNLLAFHIKRFID